MSIVEPVEEHGVEEHTADASPLRLVPRTGAVDLAAAEQAVSDLLGALGQDVASDHLRETPRRVAQAYGELLRPELFRLATFPNDEGYDELGRSRRRCMACCATMRVRARSSSRCERLTGR